MWFRRVLIRVELLVHINGIVNLVEVKGHQYNIYSVQSDSGRGQRSLSVVALLLNTLPTGGMSPTVQSTNGEPYFIPWMPISFQVAVNELAM